MKEAEFIKWMCEKADGFKYDGFVIILPAGNTKIGGSMYDNDYHPLLLTKAIEGINRSRWNDSRNPSICIDHAGVEVFWDSDTFKNFDFEDKDFSEDQAKEAALRYVWEMER